MSKHPIVLTVYNRPLHTARVLAALWEHRVEPLYIFCDGPKGSNDVGAVREVRQRVANIRWTVPTVIAQRENMGLSHSIVAAVDFVLGRHDSMILLEDDCIPGPYFFDYMFECLDRYKDDDQAMSIGGYTPPLPQAVLEDYPWDVYFAPRIESWGWGTWQRAWKYYERDVASAFQQALKEGVSLKQGGADVPAMIYRKIAGQLDAWSPGWLLGVYLNKGYCVYPTVSHIHNIGFGGGGVHCQSGGSRFVSPMADRRPTRFPDNVVVNAEIVRAMKEFYS